MVFIMTEKLNEIRNIFVFTVPKQKQPLLGVNGGTKYFYLFIDVAERDYITAQPDNKLHSC